MSFVDLIDFYEIDSDFPEYEDTAHYFHTPEASHRRNFFLMLWKSREVIGERRRILSRLGTSVQSFIPKSDNIWYEPPAIG